MGRDENKPTKAFLKECPGKAIKIHMTRYMEAGTPDTFASIPGGPCPCCGEPVVCSHCGFKVGVAMVQEFKSPGAKPPDPIQKIRLRQWQAAGALVGVPRTKDEALALVGPTKLPDAG